MAIPWPLGDSNRRLWGEVKLGYVMKPKAQQNYLYSLTIT